MDSVSPLLDTHEGQYKEFTHGREKYQKLSTSTTTNDAIKKYGWDMSSRDKELSLLDTHGEINEKLGNLASGLSKWNDIASDDGDRQSQDKYCYHCDSEATTSTDTSTSVTDKNCQPFPCPSYILQKTEKKGEGGGSGKDIIEGFDCSAQQYGSGSNNFFFVNHKIHFPNIHP